MAPTGERELEIVLWGATGYTGRLVAEYLATAPSAQGLRWGLAGRDRSRLEAVRAAIGRPELPIHLADAGDAASLTHLAHLARVVCTTVGPYARYGDGIVAACVDAGTHLCDLTGELPWVRRTIDRHHEAARARGARIVHCCGFDSIPSDLSVFLLHQELRARGRSLARVDSYFGEMRGGTSGGTVASALLVSDELRRDPSLKALLLDPYALVPGGTGPDRRDFAGIGREPRLDRFTGPFVMAGINAPIVRRSNMLLDYAYGRDLRYHERMSFAPGPRGLLLATAVTGGLAALLTALQLPLLRTLIERRLPRPGEGPSPETRARGRFVMRAIAESTPGPGGHPETLFSVVEDHRDPGYGSTAAMLAESALCLARDPLDGPGGILTPASAMGAPLLARLRAAGMRWEVGTSPS